MTKCNYVKNYINIITGEEINFKCDKKSINNSDKCKFHLEGYLTDETRENIIQEFQTILTTAKLRHCDSKNPIQCIGYILPSVSLVKPKTKKLTISIDFAFAEFKEKIDFSKIHFEQKMSFYNTIFNESASFTFSLFKEPVYFSFSKFLSTSNSFQYANFEALVDFAQSTMRNIKFKEATFTNVCFTESRFYDDVSFWNVTFLNNAIFKDSIFCDPVDFSESQFKSFTEFEGVTFINNANFSKVSFKNQIKFNGNLSNVSFLDTDIKKVIFGNKTSWEKLDLTNKNEKSTRKNIDFKIYDEKLLEKSDETQINLESVKNVYRDLRDNFDQNLRYDIAGEFFVREMELTRKYQDKHQGNRFITTKKFLLKRVIFSFYWWYNIIGQYGQSYYRPIISAVPIITLGTCILLNESMEKGVVISMNVLYDGSLQNAFARSLSAFIPFLSFTKTLTSTDYMLRLLLLPISITFFVSLKRKMERKLRH